MGPILAPGILSFRILCAGACLSGVEGWDSAAPSLLGFPADSLTRTNLGIRIAFEQRTWQALRPWIRIKSDLRGESRWRGCRFSWGSRLPWSMRSAELVRRRLPAWR